MNRCVNGSGSCRRHSSVINPHKDAAGRDTTLKEKKLSVVVEINLERMHIHGKRVATFPERAKMGCVTLSGLIRQEAFIFAYGRVLKTEGHTRHTQELAALPPSHHAPAFSHSSHSHTLHTSRRHQQKPCPVTTTQHQPGASRLVPRGGAATTAFTYTT